MTQPAVGGPIEEVNIDGRRFVVAADADAERDLGGFTNEVSPNGDGSARLLKTRKAWKLSGLSLEINSNRGDLEYLQGKADSKEFFPISVKHCDGAVYGGSGQITGDIKASGMKAVCPVEFSGPKKLEKR
jgi:hypothetical protein